MDPQVDPALHAAVAAAIDAQLKDHAQHDHSAREALIGGGLGTLLAGPIIKLVLAKMLPVVEAAALKLIDAEVASVAAQHPGLDLSFLHGVAVMVFNMIGPTATAAGQPGPATGPSIA